MVNTDFFFFRVKKGGSRVLSQPTTLPRYIAYRYHQPIMVNNELILKVKCKPDAIKTYQFKFCDTKIVLTVH